MTAADQTAERMSLASPAIIVERDDGLFQIDIGDDAPGPFASRSFALAVAALEGRSQAQRTAANKNIFRLR